MAPKKLDQEEVLRAFRACPDLAARKFQQLLPHVFQAVGPLADALCVTWSLAP